MKQAIRKTLMLAAFGIAATAAAGSAQAGGVDWHIGINLPGVFYPAPPVVYGPPPVVYAPPPVVYAPAPPVYYEPAPIVYRQPVPVYVQPSPRGYWHEGHWREGRWQERERRAYPHGQPAYGYEDRNGDGRPDRYRY